MIAMTWVGKGLYKTMTKNVLFFTVGGVVHCIVPLVIQDTDTDAPTKLQTLICLALLPPKLSPGSRDFMRHIVICVYFLIPSRDVIQLNNSGTGSPSGIPNLVQNLARCENRKSCGPGTQPC